MSKTRKQNRVIEKLRAAFPYLSWRYEKHWHQMPYPPTPWYNNEGWGVTAYSVSNGCCMDPCEHYRTQYRRSDTGEEIYLDSIRLGGHGPVYKTSKELFEEIFGPCLIQSP